MRCIQVALANKTCIRLYENDCTFATLSRRSAERTYLMRIPDYTLQEKLPVMLCELQLLGGVRGTWLI
jgi:hypothetical protein